MDGRRGQPRARFSQSFGVDRPERAVLLHRHRLRGGLRRANGLQVTPVSVVVCLVLDLWQCATTIEKLSALLCRIECTCGSRDRPGPRFASQTVRPSPSNRSCAWLELTEIRLGGCLPPHGVVLLRSGLPSIVLVTVRRSPELPLPLFRAAGLICCLSVVPRPDAPQSFLAFLSSRAHIVRAGACSDQYRCFPTTPTGSSCPGRRKSPWRIHPGMGSISALFTSL